MKIEFYSTNDESLKSIRTQHEICKILMEFRKVNHLYNNFIAGLDCHLDNDGLIHPSYNLHGTVTGRMSSNEPKLSIGLPKLGELRETP